MGPLKLLFFFHFTNCLERHGRAVCRRQELKKVIFHILLTRSGSPWTGSGPIEIIHFSHFTYCLATWPGWVRAPSYELLKFGKLIISWRPHPVQPDRLRISKMCKINNFLVAAPSPARSSTS